MNNCCIVINTCKQYYSNIKNLISQINEYNFPKQNILIISGQEDIEETFFEDNIKVIRVRYTGLHLTGMIYINEHIESYDHIKYWVFLPDTIKFGKNFYSLLTKYYNEYLQKGDILSLGFISPCLYLYKDTVAYLKDISYLTNMYLGTQNIQCLAHIVNPYIGQYDNVLVRQSMDMGILHSSHIINITTYLQKIKTYDISIENLSRLKKKLIIDENTTLGFPSSYKNVDINKELIIHPDLIRFITKHYDDLKETLIENGKIKQIYFVLLDLYKFQRNFSGLAKDINLTL